MVFVIFPDDLRDRPEHVLSALDDVRFRSFRIDFQHADITARTRHGYAEIDHAASCRRTLPFRSPGIPCGLNAAGPDPKVGEALAAPERLLVRAHTAFQSIRRDVLLEHVKSTRVRFVRLDSQRGKPRRRIERECADVRAHVDQRRPWLRRGQLPAITGVGKDLEEQKHGGVSRTVQQDLSIPETQRRHRRARTVRVPDVGRVRQMLREQRAEPSAPRQVDDALHSW